MRRKCAGDNRACSGRQAAQFLNVGGVLCTMTAGGGGAGGVGGVRGEGGGGGEGGGVGAGGGTREWLYSGCGPQVGILL